ncbi:MAG: hypothetical protein P4M15_04275 [Alphaproteobacteria bacterium]|nr:hypothetical protein [Alphaproteobacteria bacterium]
MSLVSSSVDAAAYVTTYNTVTSHPKNETSSEAISIGNLNEENTSISLSDNGTAATSAVSATFQTEAEGTVSLSTKDITGTASLRFQLYDSSGNVVADSQGTSDQVAAYNEWANGTLQVAGGTYTATATPNDSSSTSSSAGSLSISTSLQQATTLAVKSQLTGSDQSEYYSYSFSGTTMKLDFSATTNAHDARVVVYNSSGDVVADSAGNDYEKSNYAKLTSSAGLSASSDNYSVKVTYAAGADPTTQNVNYSLQLYGGNSYSVIYKNKVTAQATDNTAAGSVSATSDAQLYTTSQYHTINEKASSAVNIGWLQQDKSMLDVNSQLTSTDNTDYYSFTLQQGNNLKFGFNTSTTTDSSKFRVQLMDSSGSRVIADTEGTAAQQAAYKELTTTNGLTANAGSYIVKVSYAANATKSDATYEFGIYSGTSYAAEYKTTASAQTYANAVLNGDVSGSSSSTAIAAYLTAVSNGDTSSSLSDALKAAV